MIHDEIWHFSESEGGFGTVGGDGTTFGSAIGAEDDAAPFPRLEWIHGPFPKAWGATPS